jgi:hypothetical protein
MCCTARSRLPFASVIGCRSCASRLCPGEIEGSDDQTSPEALSMQQAAQAHARCLECELLHVLSSWAVGMSRIQFSPTARASASLSSSNS